MADKRFRLTKEEIEQERASQTKFCVQCETEKPFSEFKPSPKHRHGLFHWCKECSRQYAKTLPSYERMKRDLKQQKELLRLQAQKLVKNYLQTHSCVDCGEDDWVVLEFDHVRGVKKLAVSRMVSCGHSIKKINEEIAKCEIVCANCHKRRTYNRLEKCWKAAV